MIELNWLELNGKHDRIWLVVLVYGKQIDYLLQTYLVDWIWIGVSEEGMASHLTSFILFWWSDFFGSELDRFSHWHCEKQFGKMSVIRFKLPTWQLFSLKCFVTRTLCLSSCRQSQDEGSLQIATPTRVLYEQWAVCSFYHLVLLLPADTHPHTTQHNIHRLAQTARISNSA